MVEPDKKNYTLVNTADSLSTGSTERVGWFGPLSPEESDRLTKQEIIREVEKEYQPIDEQRIRIIDIQQRIGRGPRWEHLIASILSEFDKKLSKLDKQLGELATTLRNTSKTYNATIYDLGTSKYDLSVPIQIVLDEDQEETVARIPELNLYASADTDAEAISELKEEIVNLYDELMGSDKTLGPLPKSWLNTLSKLIIKKGGYD